MTALVGKLIGKREEAGVHETFNILFTSAGRRVELVGLFRKALEACSLQGTLVTADLKPSAPAHRAGDVAVLVPPVSAPDYIPRLKELCKEHCIRLLVPLIDTELHLLAPLKDEFAALGTTLLVSSVAVTELSLDKRRTHDFFVAAGIPCPALLEPSGIAADAYPLLLKPAQGSSSNGVYKIRNERELRFFMEYVPEAILQPLLKGEEYTLDIFADTEGKVRCVVPRLRLETRAGEISKGVTVRNPALIEAGKQVVEALPGAFGPITVQCFLGADGAISFIEINPRFGGGFPLSAAAGADYPRWIIEMLLGMVSDISNDGWRDGVAMLRYDQAFYVDRACLEN